MKIPSLILRITAFFLAIGLALPGPAFSLRNSQPEYPPQRAGLEQALAGMEEGSSRVPGINSDLPERWIWLDRVLKIVEVMDRPEPLRKALAGHLAVYGMTDQTVQATWQTLEAFRSVLLESKEVTQDKVFNSVLPMWRAAPEEEMSLRLSMISLEPALLDRIKDPRVFRARFLEGVARLTAQGRTPAVLGLHQEAKQDYWNLLRESWASDPKSFLLESLSRFPGRPEDRQDLLLRSGKYFLASATLSTAELVRELESIQEAERVTLDMGFGPMETTLQGLRHRFQNDVATWDKVSALRYEASESPPDGLSVQVSLAPHVRVEPVGDLKGVLGLGQDEGLSARAGTVGDLRQWMAARLRDPDLRNHFLSVPVDEVIDIERDGKDVASIREGSPLRQGDVLFVGLPPKPGPGESWAGLANALYRVPELYKRHFGDISFQGSFDPGEWKRFLAAVKRESPKAYESLKKLPVPERYVIHGDLLRSEPGGRGFLVTGDPGSGKSFLSSLLAGPEWEYLVNDTAFVLRIGDQVIGGMFPGYAPGRLTTRYPIPGAKRVRPKGASHVLYQPDISEKQQFVPLRGIAWLNRRPSLKGSRDLKEILGITNRAGQITHEWTEGFTALAQKLPVHEEFLGVSAGKPRFQQAAEDVTRWAQKAGMEESVRLQPGEGVSGELYRKLFPAGLAPLENVLDGGPLQKLLKGEQEGEGVPAGAKVALRIVPGHWVEAQELSQLGLQPLLDANPTAAYFIRAAEWPPGLKSETDGREYLEFRLPEGKTHQVGDLPGLGVLRIYPAETYGFGTGSFSQKLQSQVEILKQAALLTQAADKGEDLRRELRKLSKDLLLNPLETVLPQGKLVVVGIPLGLPDAKTRNDFAKETDLPADRLISEEELKEEEQARAASLAAARAAEAATQPLPPEANDLNALIGRSQDDLRGELQRLQSEHGEYLSSEGIKEVEQRIEGLDSFRIRSAAAVVAQDSAKKWELLGVGVLAHAAATRQTLGKLPARSPVGKQLQTAVEKLTQEFPELVPVFAEEPPAAYVKQLLENPEARKQGWSPIRLAQFLRLYRQVRQDLQERLPGVPWFEGVFLKINSDDPRTSHFVYSGSSQKMVLVLNLNKSAESTLNLKAYHILQPWAKAMLLMDPAIEQVDPKFWAALRREPSPEDQIKNFYGQQPSPKSADEDLIDKNIHKVRAQRLREGLAGHPWFTGVPAGLVIPVLIKAYIPQMEADAVQLASEKIVFLLARDKTAMIDEYLTISENDFQEMEVKLTQWDTLKAFRSRFERIIQSAQSQGGSKNYGKGLSGVFRDLISKRMVPSLEMVDYLTRERVRLEYLSRDPQHGVRAGKLLAEIERQSSRILKENREILQWVVNTALDGFPTPSKIAAFNFDWNAHYENLHRDLSTIFNGIELRQPALPVSQSGVEESVRLQPGEGVSGELYRKLLPSGQLPLDQVTGLLARVLKGREEMGGLPASAKVALRIVPSGWIEEKQWLGLGLVQLLDPKTALGYFLRSSEWPPGLKSETDGREYLEFRLPEGKTYQVGDLPGLGVLRIYPAETYGFGTGSFSQKLQSQVEILRQAVLLSQAADQGEDLRREMRKLSKDLLLDPLETALGQGKLVVVGIPLGLPDAEARNHFAKETDLPGDRLISEEELREEEQARAAALAAARAAEAASKPAVLPPAAEQFNTRIAEVQQELRAALAEVRGAHEEIYLNGQRIREIENQIGQMGSLRMEARRLPADPGILDKEIQQAYSKMGDRQRRIAERLEVLLDAPLEDKQLNTAVGRLLEQFPELVAPYPPEMAENLKREFAVRWYEDLFKNRKVREKGWSPAHAAELLKNARWVGDRVREKIPGAPWFSSVMFLFEPNQDEPIRLAISGSSRRFAILVNMDRAGKVLSEMDKAFFGTVILDEWAKVLLLLDPGLGRASAEYAAAFSRSPSLENILANYAGTSSEKEKKEGQRLINQTDSALARQLRQGLAENPWLVAPPVSWEYFSDSKEWQKVFDHSMLRLFFLRIAFLTGADWERSLQESFLGWMEKHIATLSGELQSWTPLRRYAERWDWINLSGPNLILSKKSPSEGKKRIHEELISRWENDITSISSLIRARVFLEAISGRSGEYGEQAQKMIPQIDDLTSRMLRDMGEFERLFPEGHLLHGPDFSYDWAGFFSRLLEDYRKIYNSVSLKGIPEEGAPQQSGLEEAAVILQPGEGAAGALYREMLVTPGLSPLANLVEGPFRQFLEGGYVEQGFPIGAQFLLRVAPQLPGEADQWQQMGFKPAQDPDAVASYFLSNAEWPPAFKTLEDGTEYLEFAFPAGSSYTERDLPEIKAIRFFPAGGSALFQSSGFPEKVQKQWELFGEIARLRGDPNSDPKEIRRALERVSPDYLINVLFLGGKYSDRLRLVGLTLGLPDEESRLAFAAFTDLPAERFVSEKEMEQAQEAQRLKQQEERFRKDSERLIQELRLEEVRRELIASLESLAAEPLGGVTLGQYLDPQAVQSLADRIEALGPTEADWQRLKTQPFAQVLDGVRVELARRRAEIQREILELPGRPLPKEGQEKAVPLLLQEYPELWRPAGKDPAQFYAGFFRSNPVSGAGWTPARVAQLLQETRRARGVLLARVPGAPEFESIHLSTLKATTGYDYRFDPEDPGRKALWIFVLDPELKPSRMPEWAPYLTLASYGALLLQDDPDVEEMARDIFPDLERDTVPDQLLSRSVVRIRRITEKGLQGHPWLESSQVDFGRITPDEMESFITLWRGGEERSGYLWGLPQMLESRLAQQWGGEKVVQAFLRTADLTLQAVESRLNASESIAALGRSAARIMAKRMWKAWDKIEREEETSELPSANALEQMGRAGQRPDPEFERFVQFTRAREKSKEESIAVDRLRLRVEQDTGDLASLAAIQAQLSLLKEPGQERLARIESLKGRLTTELDTLSDPDKEDPYRIVTTGRWISIYQRLLSGYTALVRDLKIREQATGGSTALTAGLEEVLSSVRLSPRSAQQPRELLQFLADTGRGDARVLHLLQLAVLLNIQQGLPIQAAGVATEEERARALAQLPEGARDLFRQLVVPYHAGDEADYQFARAVAEGMIRDFHPELVISTVEDPLVIGWFFEALQRLGITDLSSDLQQRIAALIQST